MLMTATACDSDLNGVTYNPNDENVKSGTLTASQTNIVLTAATNKQNVLDLNWTESDFAIPVAITYLVQMDQKDGDFSNAYTLASTTGTSISFLGNELNKAILGLQTLKNPDATPSYDPMDVDVRLISYFTEDSDTLKSEIVSMNITPYAGRVEYPKLSVPGGHQGWDPANYTQALYALNGDKVYEGYVYMPANTEFKFADGSWDVNWGSDDGKTLTSGGGNIMATEGGCYYIKVDIEQLTFSMELRNWGIVGDAVGSWDNDVMLTYDASNNIYRATVDFVNGAFKFRANQAWDINLGADPNGEEGDLIANGDNISALPGQYTVALSFAEGYTTYKLYAGTEICDFPMLYMPGSMNGWDVKTTANVVVSINDNGTYNGYVYLNDTDEFKFTEGSWADDETYGSSDGKTLVQPGDNVKPAEGEGCYYLTVNPEALTMSMEKTAWGIVGDAVGSWDVDQMMNWNAEKGCFEATVTMAAGTWKFRANGKWDLNYGDDGEGGLKLNGDNFTLEEAGTYYITLDLVTRAGNYVPSFTITKQ